MSLVAIYPDIARNIAKYAFVCDAISLSSTCHQLRRVILSSATSLRERAFHKNNFALFPNLAELRCKGPAAREPSPVDKTHFAAYSDRICLSPVNTSSGFERLPRSLTSLEVPTLVLDEGTCFPQLMQIRAGALVATRANLPALVDMTINTRGKCDIALMQRLRRLKAPYASLRHMNYGYSTIRQVFDQYEVLEITETQECVFRYAKISCPDAQGTYTTTQGFCPHLVQVSPYFNGVTCQTKYPGTSENKDKNQQLIVTIDARVVLNIPTDERIYILADEFVVNNNAFIIDDDPKTSIAVSNITGTVCMNDAEYQFLYMPYYITIIRDTFGGRIKYAPHSSRLAIFRPSTWRVLFKKTDADLERHHTAAQIMYYNIDDLAIKVAKIELVDCNIKTTVWPATLRSLSIRGCEIDVCGIEAVPPLRTLRIHRNKYYLYMDARREDIEPATYLSLWADKLTSLSTLSTDACVYDSKCLPGTLTQLFVYIPRHATFSLPPKLDAPLFKNTASLCCGVRTRKFYCK